MTARLRDPQRWAEIAAAALNEIGLPARPVPEDDYRIEIEADDADPRVLWRACCIADRGIGDEPETFEAWCARERATGLPARIDYFDRWGCP